MLSRLQNQRNRLNNQFKFVLLTLFIFLGNFSFTNGQTIKHFQPFIDNARLVYNRPNGFFDIDDLNSFFYYTRTKYVYPFDYRIINADSSICIGFRAYQLELKYDSSKLFQKIFPGRKENGEYKLPIRHKADTINHKLNYYSPEKSKKLFNATIAGDYYMYNFENPYEKRFYHCRIVFMHKENIGDAEIYYFYNTGEEEKVGMLIKKAYKMLRFK